MPAASIYELCHDTALLVRWSLQLGQLILAFALSQTWACLTGRLIDEMRSGVDIETHPGELDNKQITRLHQLLHEAKFKDPDGFHLSPAGQPLCLCNKQYNVLQCNI